MINEFSWSDGTGVNESIWPQQAPLLKVQLGTAPRYDYAEGTYKAIT